MLDSVEADWDIRRFVATPAFTKRCAWGNTKMTQDDSRAGSLGGLRVMVIDDSKTIRRTAETLLKREGAEVTTATDGFEALAKIADQKPQLIFVDKIGRASGRARVCRYG